MPGRCFGGGERIRWTEGAIARGSDEMRRTFNQGRWCGGPVRRRNKVVYKKGRALRRAEREAEGPGSFEKLLTRNPLQLLVYETKVSGDGRGLKYVWNGKTRS